GIRERSRRSSRLEESETGTARPRTEVESEACSSTSRRYHPAHVRYGISLRLLSTPVRRARRLPPEPRLLLHQRRRPSNPACRQRFAALPFSRRHRRALQLESFPQLSP